MNREIEELMAEHRQRLHRLNDMHEKTVSRLNANHEDTVRTIVRTYSGGVWSVTIVFGMAVLALVAATFGLEIINECR